MNDVPALILIHLLELYLTFPFGLVNKSNNINYINLVELQILGPRHYVIHKLLFFSSITQDNIYIYIYIYIWTAFY